MNEISALIGICAAIGIGVMSPGPSFIMIARIAIASSRGEGLTAAVGMGGAGVLFAAAALLGLNGLLLAVPSIYLFLKLVGGLYLVYLGVRIFLAADQSLDMHPDVGMLRTTRARALVLGFMTNASNPKTAIVYASVFAAFLPQSPSFLFNLAVIVGVAIIEVGWYSVVALMLSSSRPRQAYLRYKSTVDRMAGGVMVLLGSKLAASTRS